MSRFGQLEFGEGGEQQHVPRPVLKGAQQYFLEAQAAFEQGRFEQALRLYAKVIEFDPRHAPAWTGQVRMLIELGEYVEARLWAEKALEIFPREGDLLAAKAVALARGGDPRSALMFSDAAIEVQGSTPYVWLARADVLLARREKRAEYCFEKALSMAGGTWSVHWLVARIHAFYRQFAKALKHLQAALALDGGRAVLWIENGRCQAVLGLASAARISWEQARQLDPQWEPSREEKCASGPLGWARNVWNRLRNA